ncbi:Brain-specific homeobox [Liparis tanakae]|uniref:Brain-specific homeobox n=1 Tax=Liparis tanakae TaxID=230148 RepID=A0A4Z2IQQ9_9TELE|nr:Brain-specific homeobox [Liparis tanakae]
MSMNYVSAAPTQRSTSFFIEDILLHKPKPLREVFPSPFCGSLASRMPLLEYGYPLMPTPILAPHPHHPLHKPEHHQYFFTSVRRSNHWSLPSVGMQMPALFQHHAELPGKHCRRRKARTVKTWFQNRRMKHKKQLRKAQDERKTPGELDRSAENSSESELNEKSAEELKRGLEPDSYLLEENDDDVDIEEDICSPDHLL